MRAFCSHRDILSAPGAAGNVDADQACMHASCAWSVARMRTDYDPTRVRCRHTHTCLPGDAYAEIGYTLVPDNDVRCFGYAEVHRTNVVWSAGRVAFVPRRTYDPPSPLLITYSTVSHAHYLKNAHQSPAQTDEFQFVIRRNSHADSETRPN